MNSILLKFLPYLFQAAAAIPQIYEYIQGVKAALQQEHQWTPEMEEAFNQELADLKASPPDWWKTDDQS